VDKARGLGFIIRLKEDGGEGKRDFRKELTAKGERKCLSSEEGYWGEEKKKKKNQSLLQGRNKREV